MWQSVQAWFGCTEARSFAGVDREFQRRAVRALQRQGPGVAGQAVLVGRGAALPGGDASSPRASRGTRRTRAAGLRKRRRRAGARRAAARPGGTPRQAREAARRYSSRLATVPAVGVGVELHAGGGSPGTPGRGGPNRRDRPPPPSGRTSRPWPWSSRGRRLRGTRDRPATSARRRRRQPRREAPTRRRATAVANIPRRRGDRPPCLSRFVVVMTSGSSCARRSATSCRAPGARRSARSRRSRRTGKRGCTPGR